MTTQAPALGCIADDYTGGTDVAAGLRRIGVATALLFGPPEPGQIIPPCDAVVVALKTRTSPVADAVRQTLQVQTRLVEEGVGTVYFKYCSTFDSTDEGNIGPVADALLSASGAAVVLHCPAAPEHGRTVYQGHHFVRDTLLSESSMRHHPLTPMTDPNLLRVLSRQTPHQVGLLPLPVLRAGPAAARAHLECLVEQGIRHVIADATDDSDLTAVADIGRDLAILAGSAGLARAFGDVTLPHTNSHADGVHDSLPVGPGIVLAGSCSDVTLEQVKLAASQFPTHRLDPAITPDADSMTAEAVSWLERSVGNGPVMIYASATATQRDAAVAAMGPNTASIVERTLGELARVAIGLGVRRVVVAGGETSGAVTAALGIRSVLVTGEEDTGVPWCITTDGPAQPSLALLLKSGNFGQSDLLVRAMDGSSQ